MKTPLSPTAIVTGGSQGLGREIARRLVTAGWSIVIDARRADRLDSAHRELSSLASAQHSTRVVAIAGDISDANHRTALVEAAQRLGDITLVVNNASTLGASPQPTLTTADAETLRRTYDVNVVAPIALTGLVGDTRREGNDALTVVNISSDAAVEAYPTWGGYGSSKAALDHAGRVMAAERPSWRVLSFDPGDMRTEMHADAFPGEDISDRPTPDAAADALFQLVTSDRPSGRYSLADVVAAP
jgi:NAD(P)-dependent dehydrogenase (short-subunit alcohol dehydrogenase family)